MIKHISLPVASLLFVALVSGCGDSKPSDTTEPQATKKEAPSSVKQPPVDEKTNKLMRSSLASIGAILLNFQLKTGTYPETVDEVIEIVSAKDSGMAEVQKAGIKFEYVPFMIEPKVASYFLTAVSPDGKYQIMVDDRFVLNPDKQLEKVGEGKTAEELIQNIKLEKLMRGTLKQIDGSIPRTHIPASLVEIMDKINAGTGKKAEKIKNDIKQAQEAGIKFNYVLATVEADSFDGRKKKGDEYYILTVLSPDGKYQIVINKSKNYSALTELPLE